MITCPNCGSKLEENARFCGECGETIRTPQVLATQPEQGLAEPKQEPAHNPKLVIDLNGVANSASDKAKKIKDKAKKAKTGTNKKFIPLIAIGAVVLVALIVVFNIHTCEECDEVYFGKQHKISFLGETEKVCKDCYDDFHDFSSWF